MIASHRFDLTDKVAVVTGATRGLGRAIAHGLAGAGAHVVVSSRKQDRCRDEAEAIRATCGVDALGLACHVGDWDAIAPFVTQVHERFGRIDILVNNAGIFPAPTNVCEVTLNHWRKVFEVNVEGPLRLSQQVAPVMRSGGGGSIIHIGSTAARAGRPSTCAYAASKAALVNLSRSMAIEWAPWGVRVNVVSPGTFATDLTRSGATGDDYLKRMAANVALGRVGDPDEVVGPVIYLASSASSYVTGDEITVAGGRFS